MRGEDGGSSQLDVHVPIHASKLRHLWDFCVRLRPPGSCQQWDIEAGSLRSGDAHFRAVKSLHVTQNIICVAVGR